MAKKEKIKIKKGNDVKDYDIINYDFDKGGVLWLRLEDEHGKRTSVYFSPQAWDTLEIDD